METTNRALGLFLGLPVRLMLFALLIFAVRDVHAQTQVSRNRDNKSATADGADGLQGQLAPCPGLGYQERTYKLTHRYRLHRQLPSEKSLLEEITRAR